MNTYELTLVAANKSDLDKSIKSVEAWVKKAKGEVVKRDSWGEKTLAYPIRKNKTAHYELIVLSLDPSKQPELSQMLKLDEELLRYLFVRV